ncbi:MAG TPA: hypothetical protein ENK50_05190 [Sedimenticola sp.]|nr:hypothetical protein [Sedimenticola sp.]
MYAGLNPEGRTALLEFAEFLATRHAADRAEESAIAAEPLDIPRPRKETVIGAIKRLSETYPMLDRSELLTETSSLMSAHIMHGRTAREVIDDLEALFASHYASKSAHKAEGEAR